MNKEQERRYAAFYKRLSIDEMRLDTELIEMPQLMQDVNEETAHAVFVRDIAKHDLDLRYAEAAYDLRQQGVNAGKKPAEAQIESEVPLDQRVQDAAVAHEDAKYDLARWQALTDAMRTKAHSLRMICELVVAGYLTPNALLNKREREAADAVRRRRQRAEGTQDAGVA